MFPHEIHRLHHNKSISRTMCLTSACCGVSINHLHVLGIHTLGGVDADLRYGVLPRPLFPTHLTTRKVAFASPIGPLIIVSWEWNLFSYAFSNTGWSKIFSISGAFVAAIAKSRVWREFRLRTGMLMPTLFHLFCRLQGLTRDGIMNKKRCQE